MGARTVTARVRNRPARWADQVVMPRRSPALVLVHTVWATCRRRPLLHPSFDDALGGILGTRAHDLGCVLLVAGCADDHVHAVVRLGSAVRLCDLMQHLKGGSAHDANRDPVIAQRIHWQAGYWAESLAPADLEPLARYVRAQRVRHDRSHPAERWQFDDEWEPAGCGGL
jgi:putative transposase